MTPDENITPKNLALALVVTQKLLKKQKRQLTDKVKKDLREQAGSFGALIDERIKETLSELLPSLAFEEQVNDLKTQIEAISQFDDAEKRRINMKTIEKISKAKFEVQNLLNALVEQTSTEFSKQINDIVDGQAALAGHTTKVLLDERTKTDKQIEDNTKILHDEIVLTGENLEKVKSTLEESIRSTQQILQEAFITELSKQVNALKSNIADEVLKTYKDIKKVKSDVETYQISLTEQTKQADLSFLNFRETVMNNFHHHGQKIQQHDQTLMDHETRHDQTQKSFEQQSKRTDDLISKLHEIHKTDFDKLDKKKLEHKDLAAYEKRLREHAENLFQSVKVIKGDPGDDGDPGKDAHEWEFKWHDKHRGVLLFKREDHKQWQSQNLLGPIRTVQGDSHTQGWIGGGGGGGTSPSGNQTLVYQTITDDAIGEPATDVYLVDASAGDVILTLPLASARANKMTYVKKTNTTGGNVIILPSMGGDQTEFDTDLLLKDDCRPAVALFAIADQYVILGTSV